MLTEIQSFDEIDKRKLMDIYSESNVENAEYFYPDMADRDQAVLRVENDFLGMLQSDFLKENTKNCYIVLVKDDVWVSALQLYFIKEGFYYIEALETRPEYRRQGYGSELLLGMINKLKETGPFTVCDCVRKRNKASLATHLKCGFKIVRDVGYDYLQQETDERDFSLRYEYPADEGNV